MNALRMQQLYAGKRRLQALLRTVRQTKVSIIALWQLLLVARVALMDFLTLPKCRPIPVAELSPVASPIIALPLTTPSLPDEFENGQKVELSPSVEMQADAKLRPRRALSAERVAKLKQAKELLGKGQSRRAVSRTLGIAESTLRKWLKSELATELAT
jgi:hypothetical protein